MPEDRTPERSEIASLAASAVLRQAMEDDDYRALAVRDPDRAIRTNRFIGAAAERLPAGLRLRVVEETAELLYLVIPHRPTGLTPRPDNPKDLLLHKALSDPAYRKRLTTDPRAVIEDEFLVEAPPGFQIRVLQESADEHVVVLPAKLEPGQVHGAPDNVLEYQAAVWNGGGGCAKTFLGSIIENLCPDGPGGPGGPGGPEDTHFESPTCPGDLDPFRRSDPTP
jgi:hypothetical protein